MTELYRLSGVSRKTLDRYRKYIIMAALILSDDYPQIAEYLKFVKEGAAL
jgi:RNA polymerase sigma factor